MKQWETIHISITWNYNINTEYWIKINKKGKQSNLMQIALCVEEINLSVRKVEVTLKQYTKFLILISENREEIKKDICWEKLKIKFEMDGKLCPGIQPPSLLEIFTPLFQGKPPPLIQKFFNHPPPPAFLNFGFNLKPPHFKKVGGRYPLWFYLHTGSFLDD